MEMVRTFTTDLIMKAFKSCRNSRAFGPNKLSIFHLKHIGPRAIEYITTFFNFSATTCRIPAIWKSSLIIPMQEHLPRNFLPANLVNLPSRKSPGISALLQLTTDVAVGFNERKPPDRTVCVAVDLSAAFDTVCHNNLLSKINRSQLPPATARWLSCYLRGRHAKTCFRGVKLTSRKVNPGVPQGSTLSPSLFSFYIADMPIPTEPVKWVCYADDLTVWASGVNIPDLEVSINNYLEITAYLKYNSLLISAPKSSVTLLTPDTHQAKIHPRIFIENALLPLVKCPRILGVYLDPSLSFNKHSQYVAERVSGRNNILKALAGTSWGQQKETLQMTYKAVCRSIINYAAPVWSPNLHDTNYRKIQYTQKEALRIATGCHKMSSIDHLVIPERQMKETLYTRHRNTVEPMMVKNDRKATLQARHTAAVVKAVQWHGRNVVLDGRPPTISNSEKELTRKERSTLAQRLMMSSISSFA